MTTRRQFLRRTGGLVGGALLSTAGYAPVSAAPVDPVRFGVIADVHHGLMPEADARLDAFVEAAADRDLDFVIQLGDFCHPRPEARAFVRRWADTTAPRHHVLGNHDMDFGSKQAAMDHWAMPAPFYSFDAGALHVVVLDANFLYTEGRYLPYADANFYVDDALRTFIHPEQLDWLAADLAATGKRTIVFSHQGLDEVWNGGQVKNRAAVRRILEAENARAGWRKVAACFCGHHHLDAHSIIGEIHYVQVNSASYYWVGDAYGRMAFYTEPLFAFVTVSDDVITIEGRAGVFADPTPAARGFPHAHRLSAGLSDRVLPLA